MGLKKKISSCIENKTIKNLRKVISKEVCNNCLILDDGCGENGSWDYSPDQKVVGIDKIYGHDSCNLKFKNNYFDFVVYAGVIQYVKNYEKTIMEIYRVLKKDGILVLATVNKNSLLRQMGLISKKPKKEAGEHNIFSFKEIINLLKKYKFKINKVSGVDFIPLPIKLRSNVFIKAIKN